MKRCFLLILTVIACCAYASDARWERLSVQNGLPTGSVNQLIQDEQGYLWMSTMNGLFRYDGYQFVNFTEQMPDSTWTDYRLYHLREDRTNDYLWVWNGRKAKCFDLRTLRFVPYTEHEDEYTDFLWADTALWLYDRGGRGIRHVRCSSRHFATRDYTHTDALAGTTRVAQVEADGWGGCWVRTDRTLLRITAEGDIALHLPLKADWLAVRDGRAYVFTKEGLLLEVDPRKGIANRQEVGRQFAHFTGGIHHNGRWWLLTDKGAIVVDMHSGMVEHDSRIRWGRRVTTAGDMGGDQYVYDGTTMHLWRFAATGEIKSYPLLPAGSIVLGPPYAVTALTGGRQLITTQGAGLHMLDPQTGEMKQLRPGIGGLEQVGYRHDVFEDAGGQVWIPTDRIGIVRLHFDRAKSETLLLDTERTTLAANNIRALCQMPDGTVYASNMDGMLYRIEAGGAHAVRRFRNNIYSLMADTHDRLWVGTRNDGIYLLRGDSTARHIRYELPSPQVFDMKTDAQGHVWVAALTGGLARLTETAQGEWQCTTFLTQSERQRRVNSIDIDPQGRIWAGTEEGAYILTPDTADTYSIAHIGAAEGLAASSVSSIASTDDGTVWIGTVGKGLSLCRKEEGRWRLSSIDSGDGLVGNNVKAIMPTADGYVWVTTEEGASEIDMQHRSIHNHHFTRTPYSNAFNERCAIRLHHGGILLGSAQGIVAIDPQHTLPLTGKAQRNPRITSLHINGAPHWHIPVGDEGIHLHHDENNLTFSFSDFNYSPTAASLYSYRLEGYSDTWSTPTSKNTATFEHLAPGSYRLHIRSALHGGQWGDTTVCAFTIQPIWWQTWWAKGIFTLLVLTTLLYVAYTVRRILQLDADLQIERRLAAFKLEFYDRFERELRNPINVLHGASEQVGTEATSKTTTQSIRRGSKRVIRLLDMMRQFNHLDTVALQVQAEKDALNEQTEDRFAEIQHSIRAEEQEFREMAPPPLNAGTLLLIEPDEDNRTHLRVTLNPYFRIIEADTLDPDTIAQVMQREAEPPVAIVIDISSAPHTGRTLTRALQQESARHIPIIHLADHQDSRQEIYSLRSGAEDYLIKPFSSNVLVQRVMNRVSSKPVHPEASQPTSSVSIVPVDPPIQETGTPTTGDDRQVLLTHSSQRRFLDNLQRITHSHLSDPEFTATTMADALQLGRTALHRKIKELTQQTPAEYLLEARMQHAAQLLITTDLPVNEIAYQSGFRKPSYFNQKFKERFQCTPSQYRK